VPEREDALVDVAALAAEVAEEFAGAAEAAAVRILPDVVPGALVRGDVDGIRRALANLLANAVEHAPSGSEVRLGVRRSGDRVRIEVDDRGAGVPDDQRELVFRRSWRGAAEAARRPSGSGLGLTIVRQVARLHGGEAWVEDGPKGSGSRFVAELEAEPEGNGAG
jgi:signal transduction histidine kinase